MNEVQKSNTLQEWRDSAPYWEEYGDTIRTMFAPVTAALIEEARIGEGQSVLDVAGGPGEPSLTIADIVGPTGSVMCTDAVEEMVAAAQSEADHRGLENVRFRQCMADSLPFTDNSFETVVSRLGAMFFPDPLAALREMLRVVRSKGTVSLVVWDKSELNPFSYVVNDLTSRYIEAAPDPDAPDAFRFAEPDKLAGILRDAGATGVYERSLAFRIEAPISRDEFWDMRCRISGSLRNRLAAVSSDLAMLLQHEVKEAVNEFFPDEQMSFPARMIIVSGRKP
jgi:SAM-dependent methyltransferase